MLFRASLGALGFLVACYLGYIFIFHPEPEPNQYQKQLNQIAKDAKEHLDKSIEYLKEKKYEDAQKIVLLDFGLNGIWDKSPVVQQEHVVYDYVEFMKTPDDNPIQKYLYIQSLKPIDGVLTQEEIDKLAAEWKPKSEAAQAEVIKKADEALAGLTDEEKLFVKRYADALYFGKKPDPALIATHVTDGSVDAAKRKAEKWMKDTRILQAIDKYKVVSSQVPNK